MSNPHTPKQIAQKNRSWTIFRLRGVGSLEYALRSLGTSEVAINMIKSGVDLALKDLGAETMAEKQQKLEAYCRKFT